MSWEKFWVELRPDLLLPSSQSQLINRSPKWVARAWSSRGQAHLPSTFHAVKGVRILWDKIVFYIANSTKNMTTSCLFTLLNSFSNVSLKAGFHSKTSTVFFIFDIKVLLNFVSFWIWLLLQKEFHSIVPKAMLMRWPFKTCSRFNLFQMAK